MRLSVHIEGMSSLIEREETRRLVDCDIYGTFFVFSYFQSHCITLSQLDFII